MIRLTVFVAAMIVLGGCASVPTEETTLRKSDGGSMTCNLVGRGFAAHEVGKLRYEDCLSKAHADGYR